MIAGIVQRTVQPYWRWANLDAEAAAGKWVSAGLLWVAAGVWGVAAAAGLCKTRWAWGWAVALGWLAVDEGNAIHERLERWSGLDWQLLYLPVIGAAALLGLVTLRAHRRDRVAARSMLAGGIAWAVALALELIQNWGGAPIASNWYDPMMIAEEALEMAGAALFAVAALVLIRSAPVGPTSAAADSSGW